MARSHLVSGEQGSLLEELFTREPRGLLVSEGVYEGIRPAELGDVAGIMNLIKPLEAQGLLAPRRQTQLEPDLDRFVVVEQDGSIIGCALLEPFENDMVEIACIAVAPLLRSTGRGKAMAHYCIRQICKAGYKKMFALSACASQFFEDQGFHEVALDALPASKMARMNQLEGGFARESKLYMLNIPTESQLDESEPSVFYS